MTVDSTVAVGQRRRKRKYSPAHAEQRQRRRDDRRCLGAADRAPNGGGAQAGGGGGGQERIRREVSPRQLRIETRNYRRRTDRRMQKWMTHTKLHIRIFNDINFSTNRIKECFGSSKTRSSPVLRWIEVLKRVRHQSCGGLGSVNAALAAAAAQARGHICPKGGA